jgi:hypothetical protein
VTGPCDSNDPATLDIYGQRIWNCVHHHWQEALKAAATMQKTPFQTICRKLEEVPKADPERKQKSQTSRLVDVVLAQAIELGEVEAIATFQKVYQPVVDSVAMKKGGRRAVDIVEDFCTQLSYPKKNPGRPPISSYHGRCSLERWVSVCATRHLITKWRRDSKITTLTVDPTAPQKVSEEFVNDPCQTMLEPIFSRAFGELDAEDRLLIKMILIDDVPQKEIAKLRGRDPGNIARKKQKILGILIERIHAYGLDSSPNSAAIHKAAKFHECLESVLAGNQRELAHALAEVIKTALRPSTESEEGNIE